MTQDPIKENRDELIVDFFFVRDLPRSEDKKTEQYLRTAFAKHEKVVTWEIVKIIMGSKVTWEGGEPSKEIQNLVEYIVSRTKTDIMNGIVSLTPPTV